VVVAGEVELLGLVGVAGVGLELVLDRRVTGGLVHDLVNQKLTKDILKFRRVYTHLAREVEV